MLYFYQHRLTGNVENFATKEFQGRLLKAFRNFALEEMRNKMKSDAVTEIKAEMQSDA